MVSKTAKDKLSAQIRKLITKLIGDQHESDSNDKDMREIVDEVLNAEPNSSAQNVARLRTVAVIFKDYKNVLGGRLIQLLMEPVDMSTNKLFSRTKKQMLFRCVQGAE